MDQFAPTEKYSPYRFFTADRWAEFRADTPLTLSAEEVGGALGMSAGAVRVAQSRALAHLRTLAPSAFNEVPA